MHGDVTRISESLNLWHIFLKSDYIFHKLVADKYEVCLLKNRIKFDICIVSRIEYNSHLRLSLALK